MQRAPASLPSSLHDDLVLLAERSRAESTIVNERPGDTPGSWQGAVASIIDKLLALTGANLLFWMAAACGLAMVGTLTLQKAKKRRNELLVSA
jgi:hypothetical protein